METFEKELDHPLVAKWVIAARPFERASRVATQELFRLGPRLLFAPGMGQGRD
jgi:hypothetical protein